MEAARTDAADAQAAAAAAATELVDYRRAAEERQRRFHVLNAGFKKKEEGLREELAAAGGAAAAARDAADAAASRLASSEEVLCACQILRTLAQSKATAMGCVAVTACQQTVSVGRCIMLMYPRSLVCTSRHQRPDCAQLADSSDRQPGMLQAQAQARADAAALQAELEQEGAARQRLDDMLMAAEAVSARAAYFILCKVATPFCAQREHVH